MARADSSHHHDDWDCVIEVDIRAAVWGIASVKAGQGNPNLDYRMVSVISDVCAINS